MNFNYDPRLQIRIGAKRCFHLRVLQAQRVALISPERSVWNNNYQSNRDIGIAAWGACSTTASSTPPCFTTDRATASRPMTTPRPSPRSSTSSRSANRALPERPEHRRLARLRLPEQPGGSSRVPHQRQRLDVALNANDPTNNATLPFLALNNNVTERGLRDLWELHAAYYYKGLSLLGPGTVASKAMPWEYSLLRFPPTAERAGRVPDHGRDHPRADADRPDQSLRPPAGEVRPGCV